MTTVHSDQHLYINAVSRVIRSGALRGNVDRDAGRQDSGRLEGSYYATN